MPKQRIVLITKKNGHNKNRIKTKRNKRGFTKIWVKKNLKECKQVFWKNTRYNNNEYLSELAIERKTILRRNFLVRK